MQYLVLLFFLPFIVLIVYPSFFDDKHYFDEEEMETRKLQGL